jgi:hypothetical protein
MTSTTFNTQTNANYAGNVANAVRQLFAALFAKKPAVAGQEATAERADETIWWLSSTAKDVEAHSPNLAAELRYIAARFG